MTDSLQMKTINGLILEKISVTEYNYAMLLNYFSKKCVFQQLRRRFIQSMSGKREIESFFFARIIFCVGNYSAERIYSCRTLFCSKI